MEPRRLGAWNAREIHACGVAIPAPSDIRKAAVTIIEAIEPTLWPGVAFKEGPRDRPLSQITEVEGDDLTRTFQVFVGPMGGQGNATRSPRFIGANEVTITDKLVVHIAYHVTDEDVALTDLADLSADDQSAIIGAFEFSPLWGSARPAKVDPTGGGAPTPLRPGDDEDDLSAPKLLTLVFDIFNEYP